MSVVRACYVCRKIFVDVLGKRLRDSGYMISERFCSMIAHGLFLSMFVRLVFCIEVWQSYGVSQVYVGLY